MKGSKIMVKYEDKVSEATEELSESVREANRMIAESAVAAQERNWKFAQSVFEDEVELFKSHAESTRTVMEKLSTFGLAAMNPGTFYRTLRQMEKDGMVSSSWDTPEGGPARRVYSITDVGEAYLHYRAQSLEQYQRMMETFFRISTGQPAPRETHSESEKGSVVTGEHREKEASEVL